MVVEVFDSGVSRTGRGAMVFWTSGMGTNGRSARRTVLVFDDEKWVHSNWRQYAADHQFITFCHFTRWEEFVEQNAFSLAQDAVAFVDIHFLNSRHNGIDIAKSLRRLGVKHVYAITGDRESAQSSQVFDGVFGKKIPANLAELVG